MFGVIINLNHICSLPIKHVPKLFETFFFKKIEIEDINRETLEAQNPEVQ